MPKAQVSIEAIAVVAITLCIFLGSVVYIALKTESNKPLIEGSRAISDCRLLAEIISRVQSAEAITEQTIIMENQVGFEKNNIFIKNIDCYYFGKIEGDQNLFSLPAGTIIVSKDSGGKIHVVSG